MFGGECFALARTHASGGVSEGAPFGFLSHGVGGQFMALLAYRLKQDRMRGVKLGGGFHHESIGHECFKRTGLPIPSPSGDLTW